MQTYSSQKGTILFISLIILLILTVVGLASMQGSLMQEKMTAAVRDGRVALEGAEATLHFVEEQVIEVMATTGAFDDSGCLYSQDNAPRQNASGVWEKRDANGLWVKSDVWKSATDSCEATGVNARGSVVGGSTGTLAVDPRYFVELAGILENNRATNIMIFNYGENAGSGEVQGFNIVVRSVGSSESSQKIIASFYGKLF